MPNSSHQRANKMSSQKTMNTRTTMHVVDIPTIYEPTNLFIYPPYSPSTSDRPELNHPISPHERYKHPKPQDDHHSQRHQSSWSVIHLIRLPPIPSTISQNSKHASRSSSTSLRLSAQQCSIASTTRSPVYHRMMLHRASLVPNANHLRITLTTTTSNNSFPPSSA